MTSPPTLVALVVVAVASACHPWTAPCAVFVTVTNGEILSVSGLDDGGTKWGTLDDTPLSSCTEITGGITIDGHIPTLAAFDALRRIGGGITIRRMHGIADLDGFPILEAVGSTRLTDALINEWELEDDDGKGPRMCKSVDDRG